MKLLYIAQYFTLPEGSSGTRAYDLASSFVKEGIDVTVITSYGGKESEPRWKYIERDGIMIHKMNCPYSNTMGFIQRMKAFMRFMRGAAKMAQTIDCDIVLATSTPLSIGYPALVMHRKKHKPYVFEVRDVWPGVPIAMGYFKNKLAQKMLYAFEKRIYKKATAIVPLSTGMDENIKQRYPNDKSVVIPNISEINRFADTTKTVDITVPEGKKVMLYAGTFGNVNGLGYVIELASHTLKYDPNLWFYLVGRGKEKTENIKQAEALGVLNKNVFVFDPVKKTDLPYLYSIATVGSSFVIDLPALWDNSANKFFDTLAAHRPIVINHEGWQANTIRKYNCGYVLPPKVSDESAKAFVEYIKDDALLKEQDENAFAVAKEQFSLEVAVKKYIDIFDKIVKKV
jgi:glycosyltransferase involved in cell wall biosynthesis